MFRITLFLLIMAGWAQMLSAQSHPISQVFLLEMEEIDSLLMFKSPKFLTGFNKQGYNNQPAFLSNTELLITVQEPGSSQTDIFLLDLEKNTRLRMTKTPESEYSAQPVPGNLFFSVVRVETDEDRSQRLWQYPLDRSGKGRAVFRYMRGIGYYHWLDRFTVALFNVSTTNYLSLGDVRDESSRHLAPNVGRCFQTSPNGRLVFVHKITDNNWMVKAMDKNTLQVEPIIKTLPGSEDFVVLKDGTILMGSGSRIYRFHPAVNKDWEEVVDLKSVGINSITRLAANGDGKLAVTNGG